MCYKLKESKGLNPFDCTISFLNVGFVPITYIKRKIVKNVSYFLL